MKLTHVEMRNFRAFGEADFDLIHPTSGKPLDVVLLVGGNGSGKSSFLHGVAGLFGYFVSDYGADPPTIEDVRSGTNELLVRARWIDAGTFSQGVTAAIGVHIDERKWSLDAGPPFGLPKQWRQSVQTAIDSTGLIVGFDVYRLLPPIAIEGPNLRQVPQHRTHMALAPTVRRSGELVTRFAQLKQWIVNIDFLRAKAKADRNEESPLWDHLRRALNTFFAPYVFDRVDERFEVWFHSPTGRIRLESLSDGFRSLFVIVTELLLRMSLATTDMQQLPFQEAVCLIDEIDAHLHPAWQERIVPTLRQLFPNVQFIATTHSPLVVSSVEPHEVFELEEEAP